MTDGLEGCVFSVMVDLQRSMAVVLLAHVRKAGQVQDACVIVQIQLIRFVLALRDINRRVSNI